MVCKINFDYEISLSDDNDSISSSEFSTDDESLNKKFVLGDNILDVNPLKIISVRQLNNLNTSDSKELNSEIQINDENCNINVPMNNYLCYDESISNFEEESVSESEWNFCSDSVTLNESEFNCPNKILKYELPTVNRFQPLTQEIVKNSENINSISEYCMKEKFNRLQIEKANQKFANINVEKEVDFVKDKSTEIKSIENDVTDSNLTENSIISPEILSSLSIDVLTEFINGDKSAEEILNEINKNSNKKRKKPKKTKQRKIEKKSKKYSQKKNTEIPISVDVEPLLNSQISESNSHTEDNIINTELFSQIDLNSNKIEKINTDSVNLDNPINHTIFTDISKKNDESNDCQLYLNSVKESESCHQESVAFISTCSKELSEDNQTLTPQIPIENCSKIPNKEISKVSLHNQSEKSDPKNDETIGIMETYENKSYQDSSDDCKDTRTSSTDSGFHDCDIDETNEEIQTEIKKPNNLITDSKCSIIDKTKEKSFGSHHIEIKSFVCALNDENNAQLVSVNKFLDLSSFKFKFINESNLSNISSENSLNRTENNLIISNIFHNEDKQSQIITDSRPPETFIDYNNQQVNAHTSIEVGYDASQSEYFNTVNCTQPNQIVSIIDKSNSITESQITTDTCYIPPFTKTTYPFKVNYFSPEVAITNEEEISQFLNYQWLKFCEKYTIYNHDMKML